MEVGVWTGQVESNKCGFGEKSWDKTRLFGKEGGDLETLKGWMLTLLVGLEFEHCTMNIYY